MDDNLSYLNLFSDDDADFSDDDMTGHERPRAFVPPRKNTSAEDTPPVIIRQPEDTSDDETPPVITRPPEDEPPPGYIFPAGTDANTPLRDEKLTGTGSPAGFGEPPRMPLPPNGGSRPSGKGAQSQLPEPVSGKNGNSPPSQTPSAEAKTLAALQDAITRLNQRLDDAFKQVEDWSRKTDDYVRRAREDFLGPMQQYHQSHQSMMPPSFSGPMFAVGASSLVTAGIVAAGFALPFVWPVAAVLAPLAGIACLAAFWQRRQPAPPPVLPYAAPQMPPPWQGQPGQVPPLPSQPNPGLVQPPSSQPKPGQAQPTSSQPKQGQAQPPSSQPRQVPPQPLPHKPQPYLSSSDSSDTSSSDESDSSDSTRRRRR